MKRPARKSSTEPSGSSPDGASRLIDGRIRVGQRIRLMSTNRIYEVEALGYQSPKPVPLQELSAGEVGFVYANIKTVSDAKIGDTICDAADQDADPLPPLLLNREFLSDNVIRLLRESIQRAREHDERLHGPRPPRTRGFRLLRRLAQPLAHRERRVRDEAEEQERSVETAQTPVERHHPGEHGDADQDRTRLRTESNVSAGQSDSAHRGGRSDPAERLVQTGGIAQHPDPVSE